MSAGAVMICGTASDVGKTRIVAGLCRILARRQVSVAPFKAQNMALNSFVTASGHEIARSQIHQAAAARTEPRVEMNPVLIKPSAPLRSQLVVMGQPVGEIDAGDYGKKNEALLQTVLDALCILRQDYDVVVLEGAGGATEINLLDGDLVNLTLARVASIPAIIVGDIERGGVFSSLYGSVALLPDELRAQLRGFVINKFRGDEQLLAPGIDELEARCELTCLGVLPHVGELSIDAEDSLALLSHRNTAVPDGKGDLLDVAVIALPHLANFTDFDPLVAEANVAVRYVSDPRALGSPDLVVLPGSKATVEDLGWLCARRIDGAIASAIARGSALLGICAGLQMIGREIVDEVESRAGKARGLGLVAARTVFRPDKCTRQRCGKDQGGTPIFGYEIHHGEVHFEKNDAPWFALEDEGGPQPEGIADRDRGIFATSLHGIFECDEFRRSFLAEVAARRKKVFVASPESFDAVRQRQIDEFADVLEAHLDLDRLFAIIKEARPT